MATTGPNLGLTHTWAARESGWNGGMDSNLKELDAVVHLSVKAQQNSPPGSPTNGFRYIVGLTPTGAWSGHLNQIAVWESAASAWTFYVPKTGWLCYVEDVAEYWKYVGGSWNPTGI
jgi:hypothetical protein